MCDNAELTLPMAKPEDSRFNTGCLLSEVLWPLRERFASRRAPPRRIQISKHRINFAQLGFRKAQIRTALDHT
jgi:hypothetical protein